MERVLVAESFSAPTCRASVRCDKSCVSTLAPYIFVAAMVSTSPVPNNATFSSSAPALRAWAIANARSHPKPSAA